MTAALPLAFQILRDGYSAGLSYPVLEVQIDRGKTRKRHDPLYIPHALNVSWTLSGDMYTQLLGFFRNDLDFGTLPFLMYLVTDLNVPTLHKCRCTAGGPRLTQQAGLTYKVQCTIEAFPNPTYTGLIEYQAPNEVRYTQDYPPLVGPWRFGDSVRIIGAEGTHPDGDVEIDLDGQYTVGDNVNPSVSWIFDGVDDDITAGNVLGFAISDAWSVTGWFRTTMTGTGAIVAKEESGPSFTGYFIAITGGKLFFRAEGTPSPGTNKMEKTGTLNYNDGLLHFFAITKAAGSSATTVKMYVDEVLETTTTGFNGFAGSMANSVDFKLGKRNTNQPFDGTLSHVAVWSKELTLAEVQEVGGGGTPPDLSTTSVWGNNELWYKLDELDDTGTDGIVDYSTNGFDGTANFSPTTVPELSYEKEWVFDGVNDLVSFGDVLDMTRTTPRSVFCFYTTTKTAGQTILGKQAAAGGIGFRFVISSATDDLILGGTSGTQQIQCGPTVRPPRDGVEHQYGFTYDGSSNANGVLFYVDGAVVAKTIDQNNLTSASTVNSEPLQIGLRGSTAAFEGILRHVTVWNRVLTPAEILEIRGNGTPPDLSALSFFSDCQLWIKMDENDYGGTGGIEDHSSSGFDGTANFSPTTTATEVEPGLESGILRLVDPHLVNSDWTTLASLTPDEFGPALAGNKVSSITRVPT